MTNFMDKIQQQKNIFMANLHIESPLLDTDG